jgi:hypothetical protein
MRSLYRNKLFQPFRKKLARIEQAAEERSDALEKRVGELQAIVDDMAGRIELMASQLDQSGYEISRESTIGRSYRSVTIPDLKEYFDQVEENYCEFADTFEYYRELIHGLRSCDRLQILPLYEFANTSGGDHAWIGLRHDVDADPLTALRMARFLASCGVCGSFYLLHTARYYGEFRGGLFIRNPSLKDWVRGFIVAGCELGIHNDVFGAAQIHGVDGPAALRAELDWLRSIGAVVRGTVAHNSAPAYGAENSEVFVGRRLWPREPVTASGVRLPLDALDEHALGLTYEGSFALRKVELDVDRAQRFVQDLASADFHSREWMRTYLVDNPCCDWAVDYQIWHLGRSCWAVGGRHGEQEVFQWEVTLPDVIDFARELPPGTRAQMVLHPEYFRG